MQGFLGTGATFRADLNLVIQLAMGLALLVGMWLARRKQFTAHKYCQSSVIVLNLAMIFLIMAPSFHRQVEPEIPAKLGDAYYGVAFIHAALGTVAELLGIYIILVAGTKLIPKKLRFRRYKPWMRTELALWWVVILLGIGTYYYWYLAPAPKAETQANAPAPAETVTVTISNFQFAPKELTIPAGTKVVWIDQTGRHNVEAEDGSFKSDTLVAGGRFEHTFEKEGEFPYYCSFHGDRGGVDMSGVIRVTPRAK
ncbi:MAG TPA: DUF420 domain-containing protein [Blastocatellia bacterium]|nr:DUF420 domain-containing protein [Blastocatellia bacterium]